ncbi:WG repeat-containing protein [Paenibacillus humicus]|uniref:WG repeat-containing protein n=1 Tax=Paenibacillus humicus TaxID=412861 RepID=UPI000FD751A6|nr:WG repeat-containing protein [Paenibacillus humicus]
MEKRESKFGEVVDRIGGLGIVVNKDNEEGLAWYGLYGLVNEEDELIIPCEYLNLQMVDYGLIRVENQSGIYAYLDHRGKEVVPFSRGYNLVGSFSDGRVVVGKYTQPVGEYLDKFHENEEEDDPIDFLDDPFNGSERSILHYNPYCPKLMGYIDQYGNEAIPLQYQEAKDFSEGLAAVKGCNDRWGFIDSTGRTVIPFEFDEVFESYIPGYEGFIEGTVVVKKEGKWGTINQEGATVIPFEFDDVLKFYVEGAIVFKKDDSWGAVTQSGEIIVPFLYPEQGRVIKLFKKIMHLEENAKLLVSPCKKQSVR